MTLKHGEVDTPVFMPVGTQVAFLNTYHKKEHFSHCVLCYTAGYFKGLVTRATKKIKFANNAREYVPFREKTCKLLF